MSARLDKIEPDCSLYRIDPPVFQDIASLGEAGDSFDFSHGCTLKTASTNKQLMVKIDI